MAGRLLSKFRRCKSLEGGGDDGPLARVLTLVDLTALGVGSTLGLGVYVLAGAVAKTVAGPAVVLSFLAAAVASAFAAICYAEFAARLPKAGSAYVYSYVSVGEFVAFTIGWNLVLEYVIGTASMAKGMANYVDSLLGGRLAATMAHAAPIRVAYLSDYPDFLAFGLVLAVTALLAVGVKESSRFTNVFTLVNMCTIVTVVVAGAVVCDPANWSIPVSAIPAEHRPAAGAGGFMPFGLAGVMAGAAKCFFGFIGFDCLATCGEEAKNPKRDVPWSIVLSLFIIFVVYTSIATVLTMMWPYYLQDANAPFPHAFTAVGMPAIKWVVSLGAIFALCTSLLGTMFPLPRVLYAMASDGVLPRPLAAINARTQTPVVATVSSGLFAAAMALVFDLDQLIEMMSIGTFLAYSIVATSVLVLRYESEPQLPPPTKAAAPAPGPAPVGAAAAAGPVLAQLLNLRRLQRPTPLSGNIAKVAIFSYLLLAMLTCTVVQWEWELRGYLAAALGAGLLLLLLVLQRQPRTLTTGLYVSVPMVPLLPILSVTLNVYLMMQLDRLTWYRFIVWMIIGYAIYFCYGIRNSTLNKEKEEKAATNGDIKEKDHT